VQSLRSDYELQLRTAREAAGKGTSKLVEAACEKLHRELDEKFARELALKLQDAATRKEEAVQEARLKEEKAVQRFNKIKGILVEKTTLVMKEQKEKMAI